MAIWKKVIVSGSIAELNTVSASLAVVVGANGYNKIGVDQATTKLSGSFTGSFKGDGSGLTGLVTTLGITGSDNTFSSVDLLTQNLTVQGVNTEINTTISGQTLTIGLVDNPSITGDITIGGLTLDGENVKVVGDLTVGGNDIKSSTDATAITLSGANVSMPGNLSVSGDLTVTGDLTYLNVTNLAVEDKFILLNSGSTDPDEAGLVVDMGGGSGSAYAFDSATLRWGFTGSLEHNSTSFVPDAFVASVITSDIAAYQKVGNIRVESGEIYIYV